MFRRGGKTTAINSQGRKKYHTTYDDGSEMVEEYDQKTEELMIRKRRAKTRLGGAGPWEYIYGDAPVPGGGSASLDGGPGLIESSVNPIFSRRDTPSAFQWRIRNLHYPSEVFQVAVDAAERKIVVRTTIKKYFKKFDVPELDMLGLPYEPARLSFHHAHATLVISYAKPPPVLQAEEEDRMERRKIRAEEDGDMDCKNQ